MEDDDNKPMTVRRALRMPESWLLFVASIAACFGVAWWVVVPLAVAGLSISSLPKYVELWPRVRAVGGMGRLENGGAVDVQQHCR